jgi:hypothetical protein
MLLWRITLNTARPPQWRDDLKRRKVQMVIALAQFGPLAGVAAVIGFIALGSILLFKGFSPITRKVCGWDGLARKYPPPHINKIGERFQADGFLGGRLQYVSRGRAQPFTVEAAQQGLLITASFASDAPIFIPWTGIREASWVDEGGMGSVLTVTVENERALQFYLPRDAVQIVQENVPVERFHQQSLGDLLSNRLRGR